MSLVLTVTVNYKYEHNCLHVTDEYLPLPETEDSSWQGMPFDKLAYQVFTR